MIDKTDFLTKKSIFMVAEDIDVKYEDAIKRCKGVAMRHILQTI